MAQPIKETLANQVHLKGYVIGFMSSIVLTTIAFLLVNNHLTSHHSQFSHALLVPLLAGLALIQFVVQMVFFLHLGTERRPRWKFLVFWFMLLVVLILVVGSLWIMDNLNYNMMMSPEETRVYMREHQGF
jgi:cytochrome o ubiquinol oxidase subunit IV